MKLFTIGPLEMDPQTLELGNKPLPYFRNSEFSIIMLEIEQIILEFANAEPNSKLAVLTGSGSSAMEAAVINCFDKKDKLLIINGGTFSARFVQICTTYSIPFQTIDLEFGEQLTSSHFDEYQNQGFTGLLVNIHETSTGQLYPIDIISHFCKSNNILLVVDAISSFLADDYDMKTRGIDLTIFSSQKSLALPPGLSYVIANPRALNKIYSNSPHTVYLDLKTHFDDMKRGQTPNTPAVGIILQMREKLERIQKLGVENYISKTADLASFFRNELQQTSFKLPNYTLSNALTPLICQSNNAPDIYNRALTEISVTLTPTGGILSNKLLRVGHIGNLKKSDYHPLIELLLKF